MTVYENELYHHGVLGQKWGVRRYQNKDGSLKKEAIEKYRTNRVLGHVGRALTNTSVGQRVIGVGLNKGYRSDKKEIRSLYKSKKESYKSISDKDARKDKIKTLKSDYSKTKVEARTNAANALYSHQSTKENTKIQSSHIGKQFAKSFLLGGYGSLTYDRMTANKKHRGRSAAVGFIAGMADYYTSGILSVGDYATKGYRRNR